MLRTLHQHHLRRFDPVVIGRITARLLTNYSTVRHFISDLNQNVYTTEKTLFTAAFSDKQNGLLYTHRELFLIKVIWIVCEIKIKNYSEYQH
jgi:hypothetical protein